MILSYSNVGVRDTKDVIALGDSWWYDSDFFKNTNMTMKPSEEQWWHLFQSGVMMGRVGRNSDGDLKSCYVAMTQPYMFNTSYKMAAEILWCIDKEYRTGRNLLELLEQIEQCNLDNETMLYNLSVPVFKDNDRLVAKLQKYGFFKQDISMIKMTNNSEKQNG